MTGADRRRVLLLAATRAYQLDDLVAAANRLGVEPVLGTDRCHVLAEDWPAGALPLDLRTPTRAAEQVLAAARQDGALHGVVATDERTALVAALVADALGLPHAAPAAAAIAADKRRFRERMREAGLPHPTFDLVPPGADPAPVARALGYPVVIKPLHLSASRGVMRADDPDQLARRVARLRRLLDDPEVAAGAPDPAAARHVLVERFVPGPEVALEGLLERGALRVLAVFDKPDPLDGPVFAETIYVTPPERDPAEIAAVERAVAAAAAAIGLTEGPVHAEIRLPPGGAPMVLELAARSIGGLCGRVLRFGAGISLEEVVIGHAAGIEVGALVRAGATASGVMMLPVEEEGVLVEVSGLEQARSVPGVQDAIITMRPGEVMVPLPEGHQYLGFLFAEGQRSGEVVAALRTARRALSVQVRSKLRSRIAERSPRL